MTGLCTANFTLTFLHPLQQRTQPLSSHHGFWAWVFLQFHNHLPLWIRLWRCGYPSTSWMEIDFLVSGKKLHSNCQIVVILGQRISAFCPSFQLLGCKEQFRIGDRILTINLVVQHSLSILRTKTFIEVIPLHPLHMLLLDSAGITPVWSIWTCCDRHTTELSNILPCSLP